MDTLTFLNVGHLNYTSLSTRHTVDSLMRGVGVHGGRHALQDEDDFLVAICSCSTGRRPHHPCLPTAPCSARGAVCPSAAIRLRLRHWPEAFGQPKRNLEGPLRSKESIREGLSALSTAYFIQRPMRGGGGPYIRQWRRGSQNHLPVPEAPPINKTNLAKQI